MKTVIDALRDEIHYPLSSGFVENVLISRDLDCDDDFTCEVAKSDKFRGAVADCLRSLLHSVNFSEGDKSVGSLPLEEKKRLLNIANSIYKSIGEEDNIINDKPKVYIGWQ